MATVIKLKKSETASSVPTTSDLAQGEVAINTADKVAYVRDSSDSIIKFANFAESDESLLFPTGDYGSVADSLTTDAFGQVTGGAFDLQTTIKNRVSTQDLGSDSSI